MDTASKAILKRTINFRRKKMTPRVAREILTWRISRRDQKQVSALLEKNQAGKINKSEYEELRFCVMFGELIELLQAKAEVSLKKKTK